MPEFNLPASVTGSIATGAQDVLSADAFNTSYSRQPPWDIDKPQPDLVNVIEKEGELRGSVLDVGCGSGEHAIYLAARGREVLGVDFAPAAIEKARAKAKARNSPAKFLIYDALQLHTLNRTFDSALDSGLFHCFSDDNRARYVEELKAVLKPGGRLVLMCFSELETRPGPRRVTQHELRASFAQGWRIIELHAAHFESTMHEGGAKAWLAVIERT